jgi:hypothetical protein
VPGFLVAISKRPSDTLGIFHGEGGGKNTTAVTRAGGGGRGAVLGG